MTTLYKDNAVSKLNTPLAIGATTLTVTAGHGDRFPVVVAPDICKLTLENSSGAIEKIKVTARAVGSDSMTIVKAQDGTTDQAWSAGGTPSTDTFVELRLTAADFQETVAHPSDSSGAHAASAISVTPAGSIAATDVQSALVELDADLSAAVVSLAAAIAAIEGGSVTLDADLNALAALIGTGVIERTGVESYSLLAATTFGKSILASLNAGAAITLLGGTSILGTIGAPLNSVLSKSANYPIVAADRGNLIDYTAAPYTVTLPPVSVGGGFVIGLRNSAGSGALTVGRNTVNIDGAAADITLAPGESCLIVCDGAGWKTVGRVGKVLRQGSTLTKSTIEANTTTSQAHGLGVEPSFIRVVLECISDEYEWVAGDRIDISAGNMADTNLANWTSPYVYSDATNVYLRIYTGVYIFYKTSTTSAFVTAAKWKILCYPYAFI